jgi:hypothetical protein
MRPPRQPGPLADPLASDVAYAAATVALTRVRVEADETGRLMPTTQIAGVAVAAAAPFIARDLLAKAAAAPWWARGRLLRALHAEAVARVREQGVIG